MDLTGMGKKVREKRLRKSWSQERLAEELNLSTAYIGMIERGERFPKLQTFVELANILDSSADELLEDVIKEGYKVRMSRYSDEISKLDEKERQRIYNVVDTLLRDK